MNRKGQAGQFIGWLLLTLTILLFYGADVINSHSNSFVSAYNITGIQALILLNLPITIIIGLVIVSILYFRFGVFG
jgi:hypothetical protein